MTYYKQGKNEKLDLAASIKVAAEALHLHQCQDNPLCPDNCTKDWTQEATVAVNAALPEITAALKWHAGSYPCYKCSHNMNRHEKKMGMAGRYLKCQVVEMQLRRIHLRMSDC